MSTVIAVLAIVLILLFAIRYIVKEKKKGVKCIGCPNGGSCSGSCSMDDEYVNRMMEEIERQKKGKE